MVIAALYFLSESSCSYTTHASSLHSENELRMAARRSFWLPPGITRSVWNCFLITGGAQPNVADTNSRTSLYWTARKGFRDSMALLLDRGGQESIDKPDGFGESPLQVAAAQGHSDCVTLLLDRGANVEWHEVWSSPITAAAISSPLAATDGLPYILVRFHSPSCLPTSLAECLAYIGRPCNASSPSPSYILSPLITLPSLPPAAVWHRSIYAKPHQTNTRETKECCCSGSCSRGKGCRRHIHRLLIMKSSWPLW